MIIPEIPGWYWARLIWDHNTLDDWYPARLEYHSGKYVVTNSFVIDGDSDPEQYEWGDKIEEPDE